LQRDAFVIEIEKHLSDWNSLATWPQASNVLESTMEQRVCVDVASFQAAYVNIIPPSWDVISISLSEDRDELLFSKLQACQTPFFLRLPLKRSNGEDPDEDDFRFDHAKAELLEIIEQVNNTCHNARNQTAKGAKKAWWTERETLDRRLKTFLENVERIWLGGFRGIFSQGTKPAEQLARFTQSLQTILDSHLPSRQKQRKGKQLRTQLHPRILELFVSLGEPKEDSDIEDSLMELLYFVVDILQFNGECNAYDEIDFDIVSCTENSHTEMALTFADHCRDY
jgi:separase